MCISKKNKVVVIGAGRVGEAVVYTLAMSRTASGSNDNNFVLFGYTHNSYLPILDSGGAIGNGREEKRIDNFLSMYC